MAGSRSCLIDSTPVLFDPENYNRGRPQSRKCKTKIVLKPLVVFIYRDMCDNLYYIKMIYVSNILNEKLSELERIIQEE